ncbi:NAD(P)H-dependent flavin oxidoreductase [Holospora obtusa]|nr:nitronate monooxygenase [Holospora obtusa]
MMLNSIPISGAEVLPLIEGGKGIGATNGVSSGAWAACGAVGTFSGVNAPILDEEGGIKPWTYQGHTRKERHKELIEQAILGGVQQAKIAYDLSCGKGRIHMNVLWEMGGVESVLEGILSGTKGLIHGVTCGAGMPYRLAEIAARFKVFYLPIVSSARAFRALWNRAYSKMSDWLSAVVYEDPWKAGGHNGLSNQENPLLPEDPYSRVVALRASMRDFSLDHIPIIMAGGVWHLKNLAHWINNEELGLIGFQFGTRPLLTQESPISESWKKRLLNILPGDILLNRFSPTGFYSSAFRNSFLDALIARSSRQVAYSYIQNEEFFGILELGTRGRQLFVRERDLGDIAHWKQQGFLTGMTTPSQTVIFTTPQEAASILKDQRECKGCLSSCLFSNWSQGITGSTGEKPDPRSFCIQKTLQDIILTGDVENNLMFAGHNAYKFREDPFYKDGFIPTVSELIERIKTGE